MKKKILNNYSKILINILFFASAIFIIEILIEFVNELFGRASVPLSTDILMILSNFILYFLIIWNLRKIIYSMKSTPFCYDNVKRFKFIGFCMLGIAILDGIRKFHVQEHGLKIMATKYGSLKGSFILFIVLSCMAFILAEIFEDAVKIKEENDMTI